MNSTMFSYEFQILYFKRLIFNFYRVLAVSYPAIINITQNYYSQYANTNGTQLLVKTIDCPQKWDS